MNNAPIIVANLGKHYFIRHQRAKGDGLRHVLEDTIRNPLGWWRRHRDKRSGEQEEFWALKDISFEVAQGEAVGIIGRNGAGKSTLLKILSRITEPTEGSVRLRGRVASLLEVGTGFHPELTGRENIFLNGAILGMSRVEIKKKFDEIVAFSEVEQFIDTPVKRYSSGMYVRLAFAVAAHLEPEILIVDEVLAVGDAAFQQKCLGKMGEVSTRQGRTVLFVSHSMAAVQRLCAKCFLLGKGRLIAAGPTDVVTREYLKDCAAGTELGLEHIIERTGSGAVRLVSFHLEDTEGHRLDIVQTGMDVEIVLGFRTSRRQRVHNVDIGFSLHLQDTTALAVLYSSYTGKTFDVETGAGEFRCRLKKIPLKEGRYLLGVRVVADEEEADWPRGMVGHIDVEAGDFYGTGTKGFEGGAPLLLAGEWTMKSRHEAVAA
jgi:lipopolysaccharide transport system ATP-binding protein